VAILLAGFSAAIFLLWGYRSQMLAYFLALLVGSGSVGLYFVTLFCPELYRKSDPIWSGMGLFYSLALWVESAQIGGGLLLAQALSVLLLGGFVGQTLVLRRQLIPEADRTPLPDYLERLLPTAEAPPETAWIEIRQDFSPAVSPKKTLPEPAEE
jgi:Ycf66 protein N-terminus